MILMVQSLLNLGLEIVWTLVSRFTHQVYSFLLLLMCLSVHIRDTMLADNSDLKNIKFIGDESTIYFELTLREKNSEIMRAEISIQQGNVVLYNKEFDEGSLVEDYTVNLVDMVNTFSEIDSNVDNEQRIYFHRCFRSPVHSRD